MPQPTEPDAIVTRWWRRPESIGIIAVLVGIFAVVAIRLGPALAGFKTFSAMDRLESVAPWWDGGTRGSVLNPFLGDSIDSLLPSYIQIHDRLMQGDWALWSALGGPGTELLASTNTPTLTLSTIWFLILPSSYAPGVAKLVEVLIAMIGMYLWMRRIGLGRPAGLLGGLFYCGSGFFVGWATWSAQASVAAMMPALFWAVEYLIARKRLRDGIPIALVVAFLLLGGFPAAAGHALYAGGLYFIVRLVADRADHRGIIGWRVFLVGMGSVILGIALSAVQTVPLAYSLAGTDLSVRSGQFYSQQPIGSVLSMFFPVSMYQVGYGAGTNPIEGYAFLGIGAVFFAIVAVLTPRLPRQRRSVVPFLTISALLAAAVVWQQGWWTNWLAPLPVFSGNNSGRLRDIVCLFGAALAAIGVERVFTAALPVRKRLIAITGVVGLAFAALVIAMWRHFPALSTQTLALDALPGLLIIAGSGIAILAVRSRPVREISFVVVALLASLQMGTSVSNYWPLSDTEDFYPETALIAAASEHIDDGRMLSSGGFMGSTASAYGLRSVTAHSFHPTNWREYVEALELGAFGAGQSPTNPAIAFPGDESDGSARLLDRLGATIWVTALSPTVPGELVDRMGNAHTDGGDATTQLHASESIDVTLVADGVRGVSIDVAEPVSVPGQAMTVSAQILDSAGEVLAEGGIVRQGFEQGSVTITIAGEDIVSDQLTLRLSSTADLVLGADAEGIVDVAVIAPDDDDLRLVYADVNGAVWEREDVLPRIRWASDSEVVLDGDERLAMLQSADLSDDTVVLSQGGPAAEGADAELDVQEDAGDGIRVGVEAQGGGYLVIADWMHRGWVATIDGESVDIVEADHALSAVFVEAGEHEVVFTYVGQGVALGAAISVVSVLAIVAILITVWVRRRRSVR
ncbi:MAG: YfhO family protein [Microbacterium sp.]